MTAEVINIKDRVNDKVWTCECGGQVFYLITTGECECRACKLISNGVFNSMSNENKENSLEAELQKAKEEIMELKDEILVLGERDDF